MDVHFGICVLQKWMWLSSVWRSHLIPVSISLFVRIIFVMSILLFSSLYFSALLSSCSQTEFWKKGRRFYSFKSVWKLTKKNTKNIHFKRLCFVLMKRAKLWTEYWTLDSISWALSHTLFFWRFTAEFHLRLQYFVWCAYVSVFIFISRCARCAFNESLLWYWIHDSICFMPFHLAKMKWTRTKKENIEPKK